MNLWQILVLLLVTFFTGSWVERRHFRSIISREKNLEKMPLLTNNLKDLSSEVERVQLVSSGVVVGADFFKSFLANLVSIFGGRIASLESVLDRARREATLRLRDAARGADLICGVQYETCFLTDSNSQKIPVVEVIAWGTAVFYKRN